MIFQMKSPEQLMREEIKRQALEEAATRIEQEECGESYRRAFKRAALMVRRLKPA